MGAGKYVHVKVKLPTLRSNPFLYSKMYYPRQRTKHTTAFGEVAKTSVGTAGGEISGTAGKEESGVLCVHYLFVLLLYTHSGARLGAKQYSFVAKSHRALVFPCSPVIFQGVALEVWGTPHGILTIYVICCSTVRFREIRDGARQSHFLYRGKNGIVCIGISGSR